MSFLKVTVRSTPIGNNLPLDDSSNDDYWCFTNNQFELSLRKRHAAPQTYAAITDAGLNAGYKCSDDWREFLELEYDSNSNRLTITRDALAVLPLFYGVSEGQLVVGNQYHDVATELNQLTVDEPTLYEGLMLHNIGHKTLFEQIRILSADEQLVWRDGELTVKTIRSRELLDEPSDATQFIDHLRGTIETYIYEYGLSDVAVEASGGLDSSTVAIVSQQLGASIATYSAQFSQEFAGSQRTKLQQLWDMTRVSGKIIAGDENDYPLARFVEERQSLPAYMFEDIYTELLDTMAAAAEIDGVKVIFTGIGGDELFESQSAGSELAEGAEDKQRRLNRPVPDFYTEKFKTDLHRSIEQRPDKLETVLPRTARSVLSAHVSTNNIFIERDIWPVAPLADYELFQYTQGLPIVHKANKNILRLYLESINAPELIYNPKQNEHFGPILNKAITGPLRSVLVDYAKKSLLVKQGLVDKGRLLNDVDNDQVLQRDAIRYFVWLTAEMNLAEASQY